MLKNEDANSKSGLCVLKSEYEETQDCQDDRGRFIKQKPTKSDKLYHNKTLCVRKDPPPKSENGVDIFLDRVGYNMYHFDMVFIISIIYFVVGSEFVIINIITSTLEKEWNLTKSQLSILGSSIFMGIFITSLAAGYVSNTYGRRIPTIIGCVLLSIFSILSCFTESLLQMCAVKVVIGLGIGIIIPCTTSLLTESIPKHNRSLILNFVWGVYPLGIIYVCFIAVQYVNRNILDWKSLCLVNSFSSIMIVFLSLYLKESPRFLILQRDYKEAFKVLNAIGKSRGIQLSYEEEVKIEEQGVQVVEKKSHETLLSAYFEDDFKIITPFLFFLWFSSSLISYGLLFVMPKHFENLTKKDKADSLKSMIVSMYILCLCPYLRGFISELEYLGRRNTLALGYLGSLFFSLCCAIDDNNLSFFAGSLNFFINISLGLVSVYTSEVYPTQLRSGALGIGNAFTRLGGITAPFLCQFFEHHFVKGSFYMFAFISLVSVFLSCGLTRETLGTELDANYRDPRENKNKD